MEKIQLCTKCLSNQKWIKFQLQYFTLSIHTRIINFKFIIGIYTIIHINKYKKPVNVNFYCVSYIYAHGYFFVFIVLMVHHFVYWIISLPLYFAFLLQFSLVIPDLRINLIILYRVRYLLLFCCSSLMRIRGCERFVFGFE